MLTRREFIKKSAILAGGVAVAVAVPGALLAKPKRETMFSTGEPGTESFHEETWKPVVGDHFTISGDPMTYTVTSSSNEVLSLGGFTPKP